MGGCRHRVPEHRTQDPQRLPERVHPAGGDRERTGLAMGRDPHPGRDPGVLPVHRAQGTGLGTDHPARDRTPERCDTLAAAGAFGVPAPQERPGDPGCRSLPGGHHGGGRGPREIGFGEVAVLPGERLTHQRERGSHPRSRRHQDHRAQRRTRGRQDRPRRVGDRRGCDGTRLRGGVEHRHHRGEHVRERADRGRRQPGRLV